MSQQEHPPQHPEFRPAEDEIDLADLVAVLHRRRWLIAAVTVAVLLLGATYTFTTAPKFEYRSLLEVGQYQKQEGGDYQYVEDPQSAANRLDALAQTVYQKQSDQVGPEGLKFSLSEFQVESADNGGVLEVRTEAVAEAEVEDFLTTITNRLIQDHDRIFDVQRQEIRQRIQSLEADLQRLRQKAESDQRRLGLLDQEKAFLKNQIQESTDRLDELLATKTRANMASSSEPVGLLLFSSEIQRVRSYVDKLRNRVLSRIPEKRENLKVQLEKTRSQITTTKAKLESQKLAFNNINRTQVLLDPTVSDSPVSPNLKLNLALSLVLGVFLGIFLAFLAEFWRNNRRRIVREAEAED
ncbi:MAG: Wzz/FepE/Etk N-terminal domain-containing protein [Thiohalorhabdus sp.]|uniref:Wzz/FepE/Etk N-terminal domain-containing protein n=1 Tax=Thiohalorhabdus sp. TaxID=3094134 RepID=UPI002FC2DD27